MIAFIDWIFDQLLWYACITFVFGGFIAREVRNWRKDVSSRLLREYNDYLETLDSEVLDRAYNQEIVDEISLIQTLHAEGKNYDDIIERRLSTQRAYGRQDTRSS